MEEVRRRFVLRRAPPMSQVACCEHERRVDPFHELGDRPLELGLMEGPPRSDMQVRDVKDAR